MGYFRLMLLFLGITAQAVAGYTQLVDSFDDGDFDQNPSWSGDDTIFMVNSDLELQLNDVDVSKSRAYLVVNAPTGNMATWRFRVQLDFSPSGTNFARVYLNSDQIDLTSNLNGYFVKIGGISGSDDAIELMQQTGSTTSVLISGTPGLAGTSVVDASVEVILDNNGVWNLNVDYNDGQGQINEGIAPADAMVEGNYFGWVCDYSSTRSDAFALDDIFIDPIVVDETAPQLINAIPTSSSTLIATFSEAIDANSVDASKFTFDNGINISSVNLLSANEVELSLTPNLSDNTTYTVSATNVADIAGNVSSASMVTFTYIETAIAVAFDILINEFMADPTPQIGLPDAEYVELFNNTDKTFQLSDYTIASGGTPVTLPEYLFMPGTYVLLTKVDDAALFQAFGATLGVEGLPTLTNTTDEILIAENNGNVIHRVVYTLDTYQDNAKEGGGYSIELINPEEACKGQANYRATENISGGSPGVVNSVLSNDADMLAPTLDGLFTIDNSTLLLTYSEPLTKFSAEENLNYIISDNLSVVGAQLQAENNEVLITLSETIVEGQIYALQYENIADCLGNASMRSDSIFFALPQTPQAGDLIINEILFNPFTGGVDYVELYNNSDLVINLADLNLANLSPDVNQSERIGVDHLMFPATYACITSDKSDIVARYAPIEPSRIFENALPRLDDASGNISITSFQGSVLDIIESFDYDEDLHSGFLADDNGVSLERISFNISAGDNSNWASGVQATGFGTPGYQNAQVITDPNISLGDFYDILNPTFSPDQDGFKDFMQIQFNLDKADYLGNIKIYDDRGRIVQDLLPNQVLASNIIVNWDGTVSDNTVARMGIYVLRIELLSPSGDREVFKEPIVVARRLN